MPGESANPINTRTFASLIDWRDFPSLAAWEATAARVREREEERDRAAFLALKRQHAANSMLAAARKARMTGGGGGTGRAAS